MTSAKTDLRKPKIFNDFGLNNNVGLTTYLVGKHSREEIIQPIGMGSSGLPKIKSKIKQVLQENLNMTNICSDYDI